MFLCDQFKTNRLYLVSLDGKGRVMDWFFWISFASFSSKTQVSTWDFEAVGGGCETLVKYWVWPRDPNTTRTRDFDVLAHIKNVVELYNSFLVKNSLI